MSRRLGRGGQGEVWEAQLLGPEGFRRTVALKLVRGGGERDRQRLIREARLGALVRHPNIVATYDLGRADGRWYVAMELIRGPTLTAMVGRPQPPGWVAQIGLDLLGALAHVHQLTVDGQQVGLVHRDIKPGNLLLDRSGAIKLADLGIARLGGEPGEPLGTLAYAPPEQVEGAEDARADLFSLGVVLSTLLTGRSPYGRRPTLEEVLRVDRIATEPAYARQIDALAPGVGAVLARALRADPERRWQDAREMAQALREASRGLRGGAPVVRRRRASDAPVDAPTQPLTDDDPRPFVGRESELGVIGAHLLRNGVVTLVGAGGMGKSRLAREVGLRRGGDPVFVDLSLATDAVGVASALASALGVPLVDRDASRQLGAAIAARSDTLWILDGAERVVAIVGPMIAAWRRDAPGARFVVTSRVPLGTPDEHIVPVGPLSVEAGVQLFRLRAGTELSREDLRRIRALVPRLDGMPLAIELAALRTRVLSVAQVASPFAVPLDVGGSLSSSLQETWELLAPRSRAALEALAVCAGGFPLEAAEHLLAADEDAGWALERLDELAAHGLLQHRGDRFHLLGVVQDHATSRTDEHERAIHERRHGDWLCALGMDAPVDVLVAETDNLAVAIRRAVARGDGEQACTLAQLVWRALEARGPVQVGVALVDAVWEVAPAHRRAELRLLTIHTALAVRDRVRAQELVEEATRGGEVCAELVSVRARLDWYRGRHAEAQEGFREAMILADAEGDGIVGAWSRIHLSGLLEWAGAVEEARAVLADTPPGIPRGLRARLEASRLALRAGAGEPIDIEELWALVAEARVTGHAVRTLSLLQQLAIAVSQDARGTDAATALFEEADRLAEEVGLVARRAELAFNLTVALIAGARPR
ncbi:MAG: protein kinase, partial [Myxococcales bacterium]|nr:protein kinase [Myxococcales bacterium]